MAAGAVTVTAPVGGWNARDALEAMDPTDAVTLENWIPGNGVVVGRGGSLSKTTGLGGPTDSLIPYEGDTTQGLIAAANGHLWAVATGAGFISPVSLAGGFTSNAWQWAAFDNKVIMLNGADAPQVFDGLSLNPLVITALATPVNGTLTTGTGALTTGTYWYRVSAINANGETLASTQTSHAITGPAGVNVTWGAVVGATGYNVYGRASGGELLIGSVGAGILAFLDDGSVTPAGSLPIANTTAVDGTLLIDLVNFKGRAIYVETKSQRAWYAQAGAFQGSLTKLDFSSITQRGGILIQALTATRDSGDGIDEYIFFVFSTGEVLEYQGDDPGNVNRWSMIGRYSIGAPLGRRSHARYASTELVMTKDGFQTMDEAIQNARVELVDSFGGKIFRACKSAAQQFAANFGWQAIYYPRGNLFLANIPVAADNFVQYVKNTNTGMWCQFNGWNARCLVVWQDRLYFGTHDGSIKLADVQSTDGVREAYSDDGSPVLYNALTAYQKFGSPGLKTQISSAKITANPFDGSAISLNAFADYRTKQLPPVVAPNEVGPGQWNQSPWNTDAWANGNIADPADSTPKVFWRPIQIRTGFATAISIRYKSKLQNIYWYSTEFIFNQAGVN